jgi:hypothetical protein
MLGVFCSPFVRRTRVGLVLLLGVAPALAQDAELPDQQAPDAGGPTNPAEASPRDVPLPASSPAPNSERVAPAAATASPSPSVAPAPPTAVPPMPPPANEAPRETRPAGAKAQSPVSASSSVVSVAPPLGASSEASGPVIELAEEDQDGSGGLTEQDAERARILRMSRKPAAYPTTIGGYAQINLTSLRRGFDADFENTATVRRLVLLATHELSEDILTSAEFEWENAIACSTCSGSVEVEQAFVDWRLWGDALTFRGGLVLVPMGLVNQWHEPPVFNGVERPNLDRNLIPTTWRELGVGAVGALGEGLSYEAYLVTTMSPSNLGPDGFVGARSLGSLAPANAGALTVRVDYEPVLGLILGGSLYHGDAGGNGEFYTASGRAVDFTFPITGLSLHARLLRKGIEARLVAAAFLMPEAEALLNAYRADGVPHFPNADRTGAVPTRMQGAYVEVGYDVLRSLGSTKHQLVPFVRVERVDNQAQVPDGYRRNGALRVNELTTGVSYRPARQLVFKADVQLRDRELGLDELQINGGLGYMY